MTDFDRAVGQVLADPRYQRNIDYGGPRSGHPDGAVRQHIARLEANLEHFRPRLASVQDYWKLLFLIQSPMRRLVTVLNGPVRNLAGVMGQIAEQKSKSGPAEAAPVN